MKRTSLVAALALTCSLSASAQPPTLPHFDSSRTGFGRPVTTNDVAVVLVGKSSRTVDSDEARALDKLNDLRTTWKLTKMAVRQLHFDVPGEARIASQVLQVDPADLPALVLARVNPKTHAIVEPLYRLSSLELKRTASVDNLVAVWASQTRTRLPWAMDSGASLPDGSTPVVPEEGPAYNPLEHVHNAVSEVEKTALYIYLAWKDRPLQEGEQAGRIAMESIVENARLAGYAVDHSVENPKTELEALLRSGQQLLASGAINTAPADLRPDIDRLQLGMELVQHVYVRLNPHSGDAKNMKAKPKT